MPVDEGEIRTTLYKIYFIALCWLHISLGFMSYVENVEYTKAKPLLTTRDM